MSDESRDYLEMSYRSIRCFMADGTFCAKDFQEILSIALRDGVIDDNEKRVLRNIIGRLDPRELTPEMLRKLDELKLRMA